MRDPDLTGRAGRAWRNNLQTNQDHAANISSWLTHAPRSHPIWPWHILSVVSLRDIEGARPAIKQYPAAEYELILFAINPHLCPEPDPDAPPYPFLEPVDFVEQFHGVSDAQAARLSDWAAGQIVHGLLIPDSDYRRDWHRLVLEFITK